MSQKQSPAPSGQQRRRRQEEEEVWIPKTSIGKRVIVGEINSMEEILSKGLRIQEAGIVKKLLPDLVIKSKKSKSCF